MSSSGNAKQPQGWADRKKEVRRQKLWSGTEGCGIHREYDEAGSSWTGSVGINLRSTGKSKRRNTLAVSEWSGGVYYVVS